MTRGSWIEFEHGDKSHEANVLTVSIVNRGVVDNSVRRPVIARLEIISARRAVRLNDSCTPWDGVNYLRADTSAKTVQNFASARRELELSREKGAGAIWHNIGCGTGLDASRRC